jgi:hypothetical protein
VVPFHVVSPRCAPELGFQFLLLRRQNSRRFATNFNFTTHVTLAVTSVCEIGQALSGANSAFLTALFWGK